MKKQGISCYVFAHIFHLQLIRNFLCSRDGMVDIEQAVTHGIEDVIVVSHHRPPTFSTFEGHQVFPLQVDDEGLIVVNT